jgi:hypothetical protein
MESPHLLPALRSGAASIPFPFMQGRGGLKNRIVLQITL